MLKYLHDLHNHLQGYQRISVKCKYSIKLIKFQVIIIQTLVLYLKILKKSIKF